jgi:3',5'-cyclic AMP phosphodiesterase CpdA
MNTNSSKLTRREFSGILAGGVISTLAGRFSLASDTKAEDGFFFVVAADPQLFMGSAESWQKAVGQINRLKPRFAVVCGDLINRNNDPKAIDLEKDEEMAQAYLKGAKMIDPSIPLHNVAGNHDVCAKPTPETLAWFEERFGKPWYSFEHGGSLFIVLESNTLKGSEFAPGVGQRQMTWLRETLDKAAKKKFQHKMVFMHHPMYLNNPDEKDAYSNIPKTRRKELLELFHQHGVEAVFSGHLHRNGLLKNGNLQLVTTAALAKKPHGFRIVKVYPDRIEHEYYSQDKLPKRVSM